jgi:succinyl-diaminopimelate desuccinylase
MEKMLLEQLLACADGYKDATTAFLQDLVQIPSVNGRESERAVAERIVQEGRRLGFESKLVFKDEERPNAIIEFGEGADGFAIIAHIDTVAEGKHEDWKFPPFAAAIEKGKMIGRGTADNKAGIAIGLYTLKILQDLHLLDPKKNHVTVAGVVDEESGASSPLGVRYLLDQQALKAKGAIYAYASDIVCIGHRGLVRLEITTHGESVHAGLAPWHNKQQGENAVMGLAEILTEIEKITIDTLPVSGFEHLGFTVTPGTLFSGGDYPSIVPNKAVAMVDMRLLPGQTKDEAIQKIERIIADVCSRRKGLTVDTSLLVDMPGAAIPTDHPLAVVAQDYTELIHGTRWDIRGAGPGNEGYMLIGAGIPTLCGFGPTGGNAHAPNEWVDVDSLPRTAAMFAGIITDYLSNI